MHANNAPRGATRGTEDLSKVESNGTRPQPTANRNGNPPPFLLKEGRRYVNHRQAYARALWQSRFGPVPPGHQIHHRDGDPMNDRLSNLAVVHPSDHAKLDKRRPVRVHSDEKILNLARLIESGVSPEDAAANVGVSARLGRHIGAGTRHADLVGVALHGRHADGTPDLFGPDSDTNEEQGGDQ